MHPRLARLAINQASLADFCHLWRIERLDVFGSLLRDDFGPDSDVDVLIQFAAGATWSLFDHQRMAEELSRLLRARVDLVSRRAVERSPNWIRRRSILEGAEPLYVA